MTINSSPLLKAVMHNWYIVGPKDWVQVEWLVFREGFYEIVSSFKPDIETMKKAIYAHSSWEMVEKRKSGQMDAEMLSKLRAAIKEEPWRDPDLVIEAFDGIAWEIESYCEDGSIDKTSGRCYYIYGHRVLETIVSLLPFDGVDYWSIGYIHSVRRKETES